MSLSLSQLQEKIDARNIRERGLLLLCVLAVVFLLWSLIIQAPIDKQSRALSVELLDAKTQRQNLEGQVVSITQALATDPNLEQKNRITQLKKDIDELDTQLGSLTQGLVSADNLPRILQEVLVKMAKLSLVRVQTLATEELQLTVESETEGEGTEEKGTEERGAGVYKHTVLLRVSGSYFQLLEFQKLLETSEWRFYWQQLDYKVTDYPNADILLRVYTLSAEKGRLGV